MQLLSASFLKLYQVKTRVEVLNDRLSLKLVECESLQDRYKTNTIDLRMSLMPVSLYKMKFGFLIKIIERFL